MSVYKRRLQRNARCNELSYQISHASCEDSEMSPCDRSDTLEWGLADAALGQALNRQSPIQIVESIVRLIEHF